jgi:copper(I)-binding protein
MNLVRIHACALALCAALAPLAVLAAETTGGSVRVVKAYARAMPPGATTAAAYMTIENKGAADRLVGVSSPKALAVEMHTMDNNRGVMRMQSVWRIDISPRGNTVLVPGGRHLMIINPTPPLREGERFPIRLMFEHAGPVDVELEVQPFK